MKEGLVGVGSSLVATVLGYLLLNLFADGLEVWWRVVVALALGLLGFGLGAWGTSRRRAAGIKVASDLKGSRADIEDIEVEANPQEPAIVASDIETTGPITIKRAVLKRKDDR